LNPPCIGVFDSGVGGLTVAASLRKAIPGAALCYVADSANAPYGEQSAGFIGERSHRIASYLRAQGAALIVVACNTATAHAIKSIRMNFPDLPIVGIEPGVKPAVRATRNGRVGVLATAATLNSDSFKRLLSRHSHEAEFTAVACSGVVAEIEKGALDGPALRELIGKHAMALNKAGVDVALLACTHYPLVQTLWASALPNVLLLRTEDAVARQAARLWPHDTAGTGPIHLASTGNLDLLEKIALQALGQLPTTARTIAC
jgi:glutamate racemase